MCALMRLDSMAFVKQKLHKADSIEACIEHPLYDLWRSTTVIYPVQGRGGRCGEMQYFPQCQFFVTPLCCNQRLSG